MKRELIIGAIILILVAAGLAWLFLAGGMGGRDNTSHGPYTEIVDPSGFVNTDGITIGELAGEKVILVDFMTYSCINCQRTFPYLNAWYEEYKDDGLEIVGIHTPEFAFEKDIDNVRRAMADFGIMYPVVLDNDYATWRAYDNHYWPRKYLIDIHGNVVYDHIGEGAYEQTENKIRELLEERAEVLGENAAVGSEPLAAGSVPEFRNSARSPETYFGSKRNEYLANGARGRAGTQDLVLPDLSALRPNALYLGGDWNIQSEYAESPAGGGTIAYLYTARNVHLVAEADTPVEIEIFQDGEQIGTVTVTDSKLYDMVRNDEPGQHLLELRVKGEGLRAYAFTFG